MFAMEVASRCGLGVVVENTEKSEGLEECALVDFFRD